MNVGLVLDVCLDIVGEGFYSTLKLTFTFFLANLEPF